MNICLIYPTIRSWQPWPPLGIAYIASLLEKHSHNVKIIDRNVIYHKSEGNIDEVDKQTKKILLKESPKWIGNE